MIESCPRRRMLLSVTLLGALTLIVLILESHWTERNNSFRRSFPVEQNSTCWEREKFDIVKECHPCTDFEIQSRTLGVCIHTNYKEVLKCASGEMVTRSCDKVAYIEERKFWKFETFMFFTSFFSLIGVYIRKKVLTKRILQRMQRQLANSV